MRRNNRIASFAAGASALGFAATAAHAAPVAFELSGTVTSSNIETFNNLPGNVSVGDTITARIIWELDRGTQTNEGNSRYDGYNGAIGQLVLFANGESLDFTQEFTSPDRYNNLLQGDNLRLGGPPNDDLLIGLADRDENGNFLQHDQVGIRLYYAEDTISEGFAFALPEGQFERGEGSFSVIGEDGATSQIRVNFDNISLIDVPSDYVFSVPANIAVPSPSGLAGLGLLVPLLMRRQRAK